MLLLAYWTSREDDDRVSVACRQVLEDIRGVAAEKGTALGYVYLNYAAAFQRPLDSYGQENKRRLRDVSRKYDPEGLFQKGVPGGFKLF